jgi:hypothetical protein
MNFPEFVDGSLAAQAHQVALDRVPTTRGEGVMLLYPSRPVLDAPDLCEDTNFSPDCLRSMCFPLVDAPVVANAGRGRSLDASFLRGVCDGSRSQAAAWSAETMAPKGPRELASSRCDVGPFECWSPGARQEGRQVSIVGRAKTVTTTYSRTRCFGVVDHSADPSLPLVHRTGCPK